MQSYVHVIVNLDLHVVCSTECIYLTYLPMFRSFFQTKPFSKTIIFYPKGPPKFSIHVKVQYVIVVGRDSNHQLHIESSTLRIDTYIVYIWQIYFINYIQVKIQVQVQCQFSSLVNLVSFHHQSLKLIRNMSFSIKTWIMIRCLQNFKKNKTGTLLKFNVFHLTNNTCVQLIFMNTCIYSPISIFSLIK